MHFLKIVRYIELEIFSNRVFPKCSIDSVFFERDYESATQTKVLPKL